MNKKKCIHCGQIMDDTIESFMKISPCNAADGDGHQWMYNNAYKQPFTEKFPFKYIVRVHGWEAYTTSEEKWIDLQKQLDEKELFTFDAMVRAKLEVNGFTVTQMYGG